jgi:tetratricopeptide (TPR) repeat protein
MPMMLRRPVHRTALLVLALGAMASWSAPAHATSPPAAEAPSTQAAQFYQQGNVEFEKKNWPAAEAAYLKAWAIMRTFDVAANLGEVEFHLGKVREAAEYLGYSLRTAPPSSKPAQRERTMHFLEQVKEKLGVLRVRVNVEGATISINGTPIAAEDAAHEIFVEPGSATVEASRAGYVEARTTVDTKAGASREVALTLEVKKSAPPPHSPRSMAPGIVLAGIGGAALAAGIGLMVDASGKYKTSQQLSESIRAAGNSCITGAGNFDSRCAELHSTAAAVNTRSGAGLVLVVGGGAAAAAAVTYFLWPEAKSSTSARVPRITPLVSTTGVTMSLSGSF